jgi:hypothetical protein
MDDNGCVLLCMQIAGGARGVSCGWEFQNLSEVNFLQEKRKWDH